MARFGRSGESQTPQEKADSFDRQWEYSYQRSTEKEKGNDPPAQPQRGRHRKEK